MTAQLAADRTPVLIGVGEASEKPGDPGYAALSPVALAAAAAKAAFEDCGVPGAVKHLDVVASIRQFEIGSPGAVAPFGRASNFPRAVAKRIGAAPSRAILDLSGGQGPQKLLNDVCARIAAGEADMALLVGSEAISTVRHLKAKGEKADWSETVEGPLEDRGYGVKGLMTQHQQAHRLQGAPYLYGLFEVARRRRLGLSREDYAKRMGELFAPFTRVAERTPHSASPKAFSAEELVTVTSENRMIAEPYTRRLVARDQVNQGAAVLLTTVARARELGVPEEKFVYLHGHSDLVERSLLDRPDLSRSPASAGAAQAALSMAGIGISDVAAFDLYSCFPIPVFNILDAFGLSADDPRGFTVTGGLPFFGGAGNNYSMHGIAGMVRRVRETPGAYGLVGANGGLMSKYSVGVYSTKPAKFKPSDNPAQQAKLDAVPMVEIDYEPQGWGEIETYTIGYERGGKPSHAVVVGRLEADGRRFLAVSADDDGATLRRMVEQDPLGARVFVQAFGFGNRFAFASEVLERSYPPKSTILQESYEHLLVERRGHVLEITINRPEVRNCLHPPAHEELDQVIGAYLADNDLWVAILTGAGEAAFCAGNDLKFIASGKPAYVPLSGFGGLTRRTDRFKPLICAVNGYAMGGGLEICLAADMVVADATAKLGLPEARVGLFASAGGVVRLPRQIPRKIALEMITTGKPIDAERAAALGLVNRVTPAGQALQGARELAAEILESSPYSVGVSLAAMAQTMSVASENEAANLRLRIADDMIASEDVAEGVRAFVEKRKPEWRNR